MTIDTIMGNTPKPTHAQVTAALAVTLAVAEAIRQLRSVPSGTLYANIMSKVDLQGFESIIRNLKGAGLVKEENNLITWIGPELA